MTLAFNDGHLDCFGGVAKEGGMSRAAENLDIAMQTISALKSALACTLLWLAGRRPGAD